MSKTLAKWADREQRRDDRAAEDGLSKEEAKALQTMRREAKEAGSTLATGGKGGLPPSLVLKVMRRDKYACKVCGTQKGLGVHHKGGVVASEWLRKKGHKNHPNNLVTICVDCHDNVHDKARAEGQDASQQKGGKAA